MFIYEFYCVDCYMVFSFFLCGELQFGELKCFECGVEVFEWRLFLFVIGVGVCYDDDVDFGDFGEEQFGVVMSCLVMEIGDLECFGDVIELSQVL